MLTGAHGAQVRARFVERFSMGAPFAGGEVSGPAFSDVAEKVSWVEKFVRLGTAATQAARCEHDRRAPASRRRLSVQGVGLCAACSLQPGLMRARCALALPPVWRMLPGTQNHVMTRRRASRGVGVESARMTGQCGGPLVRR